MDRKLELLQQVLEWEWFESGILADFAVIAVAIVNCRFLAAQRVEASTFDHGNLKWEFVVAEFH